MLLPLKNNGHFFGAVELISEVSLEMVAVNCISCVLPQALSELIFSLSCVS